MKKFALVAALVILLGTFTCGFNEAKAFGGTMSCNMTIYVHVKKPNATITLRSNKGTAKVNTHIASFIRWRTKDEKHHGFYLVQGYGFGGNVRWTPSATRNLLDAVGMTPQKRTETITLRFPRTGKYAVTVRPMNLQQINNYWRVDTIKSWSKYPSWTVSNMYNCTVTVW